MSKTKLQENNDRLSYLITELQGKTITTEYEIINIPIPSGTNDINVHYLLSRVTSAYGIIESGGRQFTESGLVIGINNNVLHYVSNVSVETESSSVATRYFAKVGLNTAEVTYKDGVMSVHLTNAMSGSIDVILINDPSQKAISS